MLLYFRRESLFNNSDKEKLIDIDTDYFKKIKEFEDKLDAITNGLLTVLHVEMQSFYEINNKIALKQLMKLKRSMTQNKKIKQDFSSFKEIDILLRQRQIYTEKLDSLTNQIEEIFQKRLNNYDFFINNPLFVRALNYTNRDFFEELNKYRNKGSLSIRKEKSLYNYIQRATVKCSPLSYFGTTVFEGDGLDKIDSFKNNNIYIAILLFALSSIGSTKYKLKYRFGPLIEDRGRMFILHEKYFLPSQQKTWILKREDRAYHNSLTRLFKTIFNNNESVYGEYIKDTLKDDPFFDFDFLVSSELIYIDFNYYLANSRNLLNLLYNDRMFSDKKHLIYYLKGEVNPDLEQDIKKEFYEVFNFIDNVSIKKRLKDFIASVPLFYHNSYSLDNIDKECNIKVEDFKDIIEENTLSKFYTTCMVQVSEKFEGTNVLEILNYINDHFKELSAYIEPSIVYSNIRKNLLLFFQKTNDGMILENNVNIGVGVLSRELSYLKSYNFDIFQEYHKNIKKLFNNESDIYELVIDSESSNNLRESSSNFPKLYWPYDIKDLSFYVEENRLQFLFKGKPINLIYTGAVPYHLFFGTKRLLLEIIHPYKVNYERMKKSKDEKRKKKILSRKHFQNVKNKTNFEFYQFIHNFFEENKLPKEFFLTKRSSFRNNKPVWFSLDSSNSLTILKTILAQSDYDLHAALPNSFENKTTEYVAWLIEGD
ncbi:Uncharacterised protein [Streptococcus equi subsp. equi]|uniref:Lantibiotic dehydratase N-terminal domain-containing protein n=1 Tax=Streptococcus equi subsp. equi TaxID=148942 RepID=A0A380JR63_9STRE|nr:hypothetical protein [Streptococcus equi]SUN47297.1 Uncharacterised protein [Streptococcus equi subsp. equi]